MAVSVTFWGVRGSISCCSSEYTEYGGNTACVQMDLDDHTIIIDAGSGLRPLGDELAKQNKTDISLLISHTHWDHICGFPFFGPLFEKETDINIYAPLQPDGKSVKDVLAILMSAPFFPLPLHKLPSGLYFNHFQAPEELSLYDGQVKIQTVSLIHPNGSAGYRINYQDKSICYISDYEHSRTGSAEELTDFVKDCDLMIYDAMYTPEEYLQFKGWGHSNWEQAALLTKKANIKKTALFHHAPVHTDSVMRMIEQKAQTVEPKVFAAKEKMTITL